MNVGITAMPDGGVLVEDLGTGFSLVSLYKNAETKTNTDGTQSVTADMHTLTMRTYDGLLAEVKGDFDFYWAKAVLRDAEKVKETEIAELQKLLDDTDYESTKHNEGAITDVQFANLKAARENWRAAIRELRAAATAEAIDAVTYSTTVPSCT